MEALQTILQPGSPPVLYVRGEIDIATADDFDQALRAALAADDQAVVDMADVGFIGAAGLRVLLRAAAERNGEGPLMLVHAALVAHLLDIVELTDVPGLDIRDREPARG